jgi:hypothetical protein
MAVRALLKAATPTGSESTPEPTMDLTRFAVDAVRPALPSSSAAAAAATNVVARSIGRGVDSRESGCTCSAATPPRASTQTRLRILTDTDIRNLARDLAIRARSSEWEAYFTSRKLLEICSTRSTHGGPRY